MVKITVRQNEWISRSELREIKRAVSLKVYNLHINCAFRFVRGLHRHSDDL